MSAGYPDLDDPFELDHPKPSKKARRKARIHDLEQKLAKLDADRAAERSAMLNSLARAGFLWVGSERRDVADRIRALEHGVLFLDSREIRTSYTQGVGGRIHVEQLLSATELNALSRWSHR